NRQEQDAGVGVLRRHSIGHEQVLAVAGPVEAFLIELTLAVCLPDLAVGPTQRGDEVIPSVTRRSADPSTVPTAHERDVTAVGGPRGAVFFSGTAGKSERTAR